MKLVFIHGWSVTDTGNYALLPEALAQRGEGLGIDLVQVWLGKYISFHDEVTITDIARALDSALWDTLPLTEDGDLPEFSCITHSTGAPVVRAWIDRYYGGDKLVGLPLKHLIMLSPANHGSPLAILGKARVGRIRAWFSDMEPGAAILKWLALGSVGQMDLARAFIRYNGHGKDFYPFVLTGQSTDAGFFNYIDTYLTEKGSDGVVRVANANMNCGMLRLKQSPESIRKTHGREHTRQTLTMYKLIQVDPVPQRPDFVPLGVLPGISHSGRKMGMMGAVRKPEDFNKAQVSEILACLTVNSTEDYEARGAELTALTQRTQARDIESDQAEYAQLVFRIVDDEGLAVTDFDLFLLGKKGQPDNLTKGFFMDRQRNVETPNHLTYYVNYTKLSRNTLTGFRVIARPQSGFSHYHPVEYLVPDGTDLHDHVKPNETFYVDITLKRHVDKNVLQLDGSPHKPFKRGLRIDKRTDFKNTKPAKKDVTSR